ncbi:MAG: hypothetical protein NW226_11045, partial [Microscillaceae bacterium]|nr:hypothetical protein [Microscillaceae bacterium]
MGIISFLDIKKYLIDELRKYSIDDFYLKCHPFFHYSDQEISFDVDKIISLIQDKFQVGYYLFTNKTIDTIFPEIDTRYARRDNEKEAQHLGKRKKLLPLIGKSFKNINELYASIENLLGVEKYSDYRLKNEVDSSLEKWMSKNLNYLGNPEEYKKQKLVGNRQKMTDLDSKIKNIGIKLTDNQSMLQEIEGLIKETKNNIENILDYIHEKQSVIQANQLEKEKILEFKDKEPYKSRIIELEEANKRIHVEINNKENDLQNQLSDNQEQCIVVQNEIQSLENQKEKLELEKKALQVETDKLISDNTQFDYDAEYKAYESILTVIKHNNLHFKIPDLFYECFGENYYQSDYEIDKAISNLKSFLENPINKPLTFETINTSNSRMPSEDHPKLASITDQVNNEDLLAPVIFSLSQALGRGEIKQSTGGKLYINLGNGIFCKILVRNKSKTIQEDNLAALMRKNTKEYYFQDVNIFSGYTNAGFLLYQGLYVISETMVFEIYFDANALI